MSQPHPRIQPNPPTDLEEERELRAVTALLRSLPAPQPPVDLADRVLERIARYEARPRIVRGLFRYVPPPALATALAAGIGGLLVLTSLPDAWSASRPGGEAPLVPMAARRISEATAADTAALQARAPLVPRFVSATVIDGPARAPLIGLGTPVAEIAGQPTSPLDQRLDRQLNHLLLDPPSFYQRLDRLHDPERFIARLAERAAQRGDATEIALELRQRVPHHTHTAWLMEQMLGAVLAQHAPARE